MWRKKSVTLWRNYKLQFLTNLKKHNNMKRVIFLLATFLLAFGICLSALAQNEVRMKGLETSSEKAHGECRFTIDYVTTDNEMFNMAMNLHLREWINQLVSKRLEKPMERMKTSNAKEMEAYIKQSAETVATSLSEEWEEFLKDQEEDSFYRDMKQSEGLVVALLEDQPRYVCMSRVSSGFYGGAHGFASYLHYVIRKSDGKIIEPFRDDKVEELGDYIYARLCKDDLGALDVDMVETAEAKAEFAEAVRSYGVSATPSDAWTDGKSLFIQYQQYEIVPYAYGAPLVNLPMEVARPYLSAELLELLDK